MRDKARRAIFVVAIGVAFVAGNWGSGESASYGYWQQAYFEDPSESVDFVDSIPDNCYASIVPAVIAGDLTVFVYWACPKGNGPDNPLAN